MGKVTFNMTMSLDGFVAGPHQGNRQHRLECARGQASGTPGKAQNGQDSIGGGMQQHAGGIVADVGARPRDIARYNNSQEDEGCAITASRAQARRDQQFG